MCKAIIHTGPQTWQLEGTQMEVEVVLSSQGPAPCKPIYTLRMRYPRIIHSEVMTHRVFSRNARSSRAVPVKTMLDEIRNTPFVPWHWGKNQSGMQADKECTELLFLHDTVDHWEHRETAWLYARDAAVNIAAAFSDAGYHKQIANRLLEPFMWIDVLVTSTEWENFLWLRLHGAAEPHLQDLARLVMVALSNAKIQDLKPGEWHLPYITTRDIIWAAQQTDDNQKMFGLLCKISAARCARISYKPFDGDASYKRELERYDSLVKSDRVHASPLEHQATPDEMVTASIDLFEDDNETLTPSETLDAQRVYKHKQKHGNLAGYIQFRKTVSGENHVG